MIACDPISYRTILLSLSFKLNDFVDFTIKIAYNKNKSKKKGGIYYGCHSNGI